MAEDIPPPPPEDSENPSENPPPPEAEEDEYGFPPPPEEDDDVPPPPEDTVPEPPAVDEEAAPPSEEQPFDEKAEEEKEDFSMYKTNVAERLWRAKNAVETGEGAASLDLIERAQEYQEWRHKMNLLNKYIAEYSAAMKNVSAKRDQLFKQYALLSENTPLYNHIGKPLSDDQVSALQGSGDLTTLEGIETRTKSIMKVAEEIGAGSLMEHQQLAMMQDEMNLIDYKNHNADYISEWDKVVTKLLDDDVKAVRELSKRKKHYIDKVDRLRANINKIEGKKETPSEKVTERLARNEKKLVDAEAAYKTKASECAIVLSEATDRSWVDFYPVIKNVMKFEINRLGRESSCYGSFHATLTALKSDYREATKGTVDAPNAGSAL